MTRRNTRKTLKEFRAEIRKFSRIKVIGPYVDTDTPIRCVCPFCNKAFFAAPHHILYLHQRGCKSCAAKHGQARRVRAAKKEFKKKSRKIHGAKYRYGRVNYKNSSTKVTIICPRHGPFRQRPNDHLRGNGCPDCRSFTAEVAVERYLKKHRIPFRHRDGTVVPGLFVDFHLYREKVVLEMSGPQHWKQLSGGAWGGAKGLRTRRRNDRKKEKELREQGITLVVIPHSASGIPQLLDNILFFREAITRWTTHRGAKELLKPEFLQGQVHWWELNRAYVAQWQAVKAGKRKSFLVR
jgi:very-short-patch-repair endonuclease